MSNIIKKLNAQNIMVLSKDRYIVTANDSDYPAVILSTHDTTYQIFPDTNPKVNVCQRALNSNDNLAGITSYKADKDLFDHVFDGSNDLEDDIIKFVYIYDDKFSAIKLDLFICMVNVIKSFWGYDRTLIALECFSPSDVERLASCGSESEVITTFNDITGSNLPDYYNDEY